MIRAPLSHIHSSVKFEMVGQEFRMQVRMYVDLAYHAYRCDAIVIGTKRTSVQAIRLHESVRNMHGAGKPTEISDMHGSVNGQLMQSTD